MEIILFVTFLALALFFITLGYSFKNNEADIFKIVGFGFLFFLGVLLIPGTPGHLEFKTGQVETLDISTNTTTVDNTYTNYDSHMFGFYIAIAAIFGFINMFATRRNQSFGGQ